MKFPKLVLFLMAAVITAFYGHKYYQDRVGPSPSGTDAAQESTVAPSVPADSLEGEDAPRGAASVVPAPVTPLPSVASTAEPSVSRVRPIPLVSPTAHEGVPAKEWRPATAAVLSFNLPTAGLKSPNYVEFWMHISSRIPIESGHLQLNINGFSAKMHLQWSGWNLVRIPLSAMKESPESTLSPGVFELVRTGTFPADFSIHYTAPSINPKPTGTSLSDRDLLDHIDMDNPLLADVRAVAETGDINATLKALAKHFRKDFRSRHPLPEGDINPSALVEGAKILEGQVRLTAGVGLTHYFQGGKIDWSFNPTQGKSNFTHEWGWSTNRHGWWQKIANAYSVNKEDKYAAFWAMQFRDWVQQCPVPAIAQEHGGSRWRGLEAGLRTTRVWPVTFLALAQSPGVPDADILLFLKLLISHGNYLSAHAYKPGNHYMIGMVGLYTIGVVFPELSDAVHWRKQGFDNLNNSIARNSA